MAFLTWMIIFAIGIIFFAGIRIIRPVEKGLIETLGKFTKTAEPGFSWIIPIIQTMRKVNITEQMVDIEPQMVITQDKLNAEVDAVVYYQIKDTKKALYNVDNHERQLVSLARTTLRAVIGKMTLTEANENRDDINNKVEKVLDKETDSYGVEVLRVELQKVEPPKDVQIAMNEVVKAEQEKISSKDFANATEIKADGDKRAEIKRAEGIKQGEILRAEGQSKAKVMLAEAEAKKIQLENMALQKYFKGSAKDYKSLDVTKIALKNGTKYVIDSKSKITNVISDSAGVIPIKK
jgi:regulator of protease activity HflC (stomatin/prohibitin superfamily)